MFEDLTERWTGHSALCFTTLNVRKEKSDDVDTLEYILSALLTFFTWWRLNGTQDSKLKILHRAKSLKLQEHYNIYV